MSMSSKSFLSSLTRAVQSVPLNKVLLFHSAISVLSGFLLLAIPHRLLPDYLSNHITHLYLRLYGSLNLTVGWINLKIMGSNDHSVRKGICEVRSHSRDS